MKNFRALTLAADFYRAAKTAPLTGDIKDQLVRAASSSCLNLAEGRGRRTLKDQLKYFHIAMGSVREAQAVLIIEDLTGGDLWLKLDRSAATIYRLIERAR
jgi:four helix bundle protein